MDISVVISRSAAEVLTIMVEGGAYLVLVALYRSYVSPGLDFLFLAGTIAYGIFVGHTYLHLRLFFQTTSDKLFLHGKYDYYRALAAASARVVRKLLLVDILRVLYETFHEVVEISNPRVFLPENFVEAEKSSNRYLVYDKKSFQPLTGGEEIMLASPLVKELIAKRQPIHDVKELHAALVVPCLVEERLVAIFVLGPKLSEDPYSDEDMRLLETLASQAAVALDHTRSYEKIRADLVAAERHLERSQRLASLGTLTAGVTHEIRNPLAVIRAETERLANKPREQAEIAGHRDLVLKHVDRIAGIVERMLNLAKQKPRQPAELDLNEVINSVVTLFPKNRVTIKTELRPVPGIKGDLEEMQEVFVNLIQNAIEATKDEGTITIKTFTEDGRLAASVSDTGKGIPDEIKEKIFDPFFSTRHEGVGLGLSIVYRIIREHGGDIRVESEPGKGTTFKLLF